MDGSARPRHGQPPRKSRGAVAGAVLDFAAQGFLVLDAQLRLRFCNRLACDLLGLPHPPASRTLSGLLTASNLADPAREALMDAAAAIVGGVGGDAQFRAGPMDAQLRRISGRRWLMVLDRAVAEHGEPRLDPLTGLIDRTGFRSRTTSWPCWSSTWTGSNW